jgi:hypothetical protein
VLGYEPAVQYTPLAKSLRIQYTHLAVVSRARKVSTYPVHSSRSGFSRPQRLYVSSTLLSQWFLAPAKSLRIQYTPLAVVSRARKVSTYSTLLSQWFLACEARCQELPFYTSSWNSMCPPPLSSIHVILVWSKLQISCIPTEYKFLQRSY